MPLHFFFNFIELTSLRERTAAALHLKDCVHHPSIPVASREPVCRSFQALTLTPLTLFYIPHLSRQISPSFLSLTLKIRCSSRSSLKPAKTPDVKVFSDKSNYSESWPTFAERCLLSDSLCEGEFEDLSRKLQQEKLARVPRHTNRCTHEASQCTRAVFITGSVLFYPTQTRDIKRITSCTAEDVYQETVTNQLD